jgi:3-oxoadipate enol-lactonase
VVVPESPGHGVSRWRGPVTVDRWVADLRRTIVSAGGGAPVHLAGLSMGGIQAVALAARYPGLVRSLTVANSFAHLDSAVAQGRVNSIREDIRKLGMAGYAEKYLEVTLIRRPRPDTHAALLSAIARMEPAAYINSAEATFLADNTTVLAKITAPTFILAGELDEKTPLPLAEALRDGIPGATLRVIPGAGHLSNIDAPEMFDQILADFLADAGQGTMAETR